MSTIYKYNKVIATGPNDYTRTFKNDEENTATELGSIDDVYYVSIPSDMAIPEQQSEINFEIVILTPAIIATLRANLKIVKLIDVKFTSKIRSVYTLEQELYYARISIGAITGAYTLQAGEQDEINAFQLFIEEVRLWAKGEREGLGLV